MRRRLVWIEEEQFLGLVLLRMRMGVQFFGNTHW